MSATANVSAELFDDLMDAVEDVVLYDGELGDLRHAYGEVVGWLDGYYSH
jgi:hypothetical protein